MVVSTPSCCLDCGTTRTDINVACWFGLRRWLWIEIPAATVTSVEPSADEFAQAQAETHASEQREAAEQAQIQVKWRCRFRRLDDVPKAVAVCFRRRMWVRGRRAW